MAILQITWLLDKHYFRTIGLYAFDFYFLYYWCTFVYLCVYIVYMKKKILPAFVQYRYLDFNPKSPPWSWPRFSRMYITITREFFFNNFVGKASIKKLKIDEIFFFANRNISYYSSFFYFILFLQQKKCFNSAII